MKQPLVQLDPKGVIALLDQYHGANPVEERARIAIRDHVTKTSAFADRNTPVAHVTASAWVTTADRRYALLLHHKKLDMWVQPGGHVDPDDQDIIAASRRELVEETGLVDATLVTAAIFDVDVHAIPARGQTAAHLHMDIRFWFESQRQPVLSDESHDLAWMDVDAIAAVTSEESINRMVIKSLLPQ